MKISKPINSLQEDFNVLCDKGGGRGGGPARSPVQDLLHHGSKSLNATAYQETQEHLEQFSDRNPWHVCFAVGLSWGHLAKLDLDFTDAATLVLSDLDGAALADAKKFHLERGATPIEQSLISGYQMFQDVRLPSALPDSLTSYGRAQERWLSPLLSPTSEKRRYMGAWNATAMFMVGIFSNPKLGRQLLDQTVLLPPSGAIHRALAILHHAHILSAPPSGTELDDQSFEPGALYVNNALMAGLLKGHDDWSMVDLHTGLYLLGTRFPVSSKWV